MLPVFFQSDGVKRRRCPLCPYVSKFSCDMRSHMEMHTLNARFKCSQCTYSTKRAVSLRSHIALHTEDNLLRAKNGKPINIVVQKVLIGVKRGRGPSGFYCCAHCPFVTRICAELWRHARSVDIEDYVLDTDLINGQTGKCGFNFE
ncbi:zinc finger, C2H2 type, partial [Ostertagia ostertagi]